MKRSLFFLLFAFCCTILSAQEVAEAPAATTSMRFGYLSYAEVLQTMPGYSKAQDEIAQMRKAYEAELKRSEEAFSKQFAEFIDGQSSFPENILLKRQKELQQLMEQSIRFRDEARTLLQRSEEDVMDPLRQRLDEAIYRVGVDKKLAFVLNTDNNATPFINDSMGEDITADVQEVLQR